MGTDGTRIFLGVFAFALAAAVFVVPASAETSADDIEDDISDVQKDLKKAEQKKSAIESELKQIGSSIVTTTKVIGETQEFIEETEETITRKESEIDLLEKNAERNRGMLRGLVLEAYHEASGSVLPEILGEEDMFRALNDPEKMMSVADRMNGVLGRIHALQSNIEAEKETLESTKEEREKLLEMKQAQKNALAREHAETQTDLRKQEATIADLQRELSKLRSNLSDLLGKSYDAKDIEDAAKFASKVSGTRKDFIMGMLVVESNLGRYTGGCTYGEIEKGAEAAYKKGKLSKTAWATFQRRRDIFKDIAKELDYDYKKRKVSCNPSNYAGTGGAMGVAQFMPDTWLGYKKSIASATGHNPPDPWNLTDGVTAMGLKLAKVPGVTDHKKSAERNAAKIYLSGTTSSKYDWYADKVLYWADNYERLLK